MLPPLAPEIANVGSLAPMISADNATSQTLIDLACLSVGAGFTRVVTAWFPTDELFADALG
jgi:hypothetical protein